MESIFNFFPEEHFGVSFKKIVDNVVKGESVGIYGMCGVGIQYAFQFLEKMLREKYAYTNIIKFKGGMLKTNIVKTIERRLRDDLKIHNIEQWIRDLGNDRLYILIEGTQDFTLDQKAQLLDYLDILRKISPGHVVNIVGLDMLLVTEEKQILKKHSATLSSIYRLELFDLAGTKRIIEVNNKVFEWNIPLELADKIYLLSGGNPRLIKYICKTILDHDFSVLDNKAVLVTLDPLEYKLEVFITMIYRLGLTDLKYLGIITEHDRFFTPLLDIAVANYEMPNIELVGSDLTKREKKIASLLYFNKDRVVTNEKIDYILTLGDTEYSLWARYKALDRLKKKINHTFEIKTIRDTGYMLVSKS